MVQAARLGFASAFRRACRAAASCPWAWTTTANSSTGDTLASAFASAIGRVTWVHASFPPEPVTYEQPDGEPGPPVTMTPTTTSLRTGLSSAPTISSIEGLDAVVAAALDDSIRGRISGLARGRGPAQVVPLPHPTQEPVVGQRV